MNRGESRTSQVPGEPSCPYALFFDPGRTEHVRPLRRVDMAPAMSTAKAPTKFELSRLNRTASGLAVYASPDEVTRTRRKTRFRPLAKRYRTGLTTRRVPLKGFKIASCDSSSFPKLAWRKDIQEWVKVMSFRDRQAKFFQQCLQILFR